MDLSALSDRAWDRGRLSVSARIDRLRSKAWLVAQCSLAAGVAWVAAVWLLGHSSPFFAPIAAVVCLGTTYGQRLRRVAEMTAGVTVGVAVGDLFTSAFGRGTWQIVVVVAIAMSSAILLDAGALLTTQAAVQSIVVTTLLPVDGGLSRILDAMIGGAVALVAAAIVPGAPLRRPRQAAAKVAAELARLLRLARQSASDQDEALARETLDRARETESLLGDLRAAAKEGVDIVRTSPLRRHTHHQVRTVADLVEPLDRALRTTRVLVRRVDVSARLSETMPPDYLELMDALAEVAQGIAVALADNRLADALQPRLIEIGERSGEASEPLTLSAAVVLGQIRSLVVDLLEVCGMPHDAAVAVVPVRR
ncbi:MAG: hypothetical protein QOI06_2720 [Nocardioidaceae bacterium]|nr:hypothetical protein [Nocardioidaceae bacterium]